MDSPLRITNTRTVRSTQVVTEDFEILQALNLKLQVKVNNLEAEVARLKAQVVNYNGKVKTYESLSNDLASLRKQFDRTAVALLKKSNAYDELQKEVAGLKANQKSPQGVVTPIVQKPKPKLIPVSSCLRLGLGGFQVDSSSQYSSDDEMSSYSSRNGRPSIGSCGNIAKQIAAEEAMPSCLRSYGAPNAPLRNRVLLKAHTIKSASTESLESFGRKSIRNSEKMEAKGPSKPKNPTTNVVAPAKRGKQGTNASSQSARGLIRAGTNSQSATTTTATPRIPPYRPALGVSNGQKMVKMSLASVKRSNSNCSSKSNASSSKPAFRF